MRNICDFISRRIYGLLELDIICLGVRTLKALIEWTLKDLPWLEMAGVCLRKNLITGIQPTCRPRRYRRNTKKRKEKQTMKDAMLGRNGSQLGGILNRTMTITKGIVQKMIYCSVRKGLRLRPTRFNIPVTAYQ